MDWQDQFEYKPRAINSKVYEIFKDNVYLYFDLECSTSNLLVDYHQDINGNNIELISAKIDSMIFNSIMSGDSVNNCAMKIKCYLDDNP